LTRDMVNTDFLQTMKRGTYLINTARGDVVNDDALVAALESGHIRGAALDVFRVEPPGTDHPLFKFPQVIPTPHMGAHTDGASNNMGRMALDNCLAVLNGLAPLHPVT
ncbi:MAG: NAD(P)-dependent oxidoreductase, partial [Chloroflexota bacterium]